MYEAQTSLMLLELPQRERPRISAVTLSTPENQRMVRAYVGALSHDTGAVDDLTQEVFLRAIERIDRLRSPDNPGPFLRGIARRVTQEHFRARRRSMSHMQLTAQAMVDQGASPQIICHEHQLLDQLQEAIAELPIISRRMLIMRYHDEMTAPQIGLELGISHGAVRVSLLRIRDRLKKSIERSIRSTDRF